MAMTMIFLSVLFSCLVATTVASRCQRVVCYYTNWAQYRPSPFKFFPENMDPRLCTHINYAFAKMNGNQLAPFEWNDDSETWSVGMYERTSNCIKDHNPSAKLLLSVGGWNMGSEPFTAMVATAAGRAEFATSSVQFLRQRGFDGLDLDWEYPANRGSPPQDRDNFIELLKQINTVFDNEAMATGNTKLLLTAAVAAGKATTVTAYNVPELDKYLDFVNIMTYDLHGSWETFTGHNSPLYARSNEAGEQVYLNVDWAAKHWVGLGLPKHKLVLGLPTYGRSFTLQSPSAFALGDKTVSPGTAGTYTREAGFLAYYEICAMIKNGATTYREPEQNVPYIVSGNQWVGYDDETSLREKVNYMNVSGYGGVMIWALDLDDFTGSCGNGNYSLINAIFNECQGIPASENNRQTSYISPISSVPKPAMPTHHNPMPTPSHAPIPSIGRRVETSRQYSGRHGSQVRMFQMPILPVNHHDQTFQKAPTAVQQLVHTVAKGEFVVPERQDNHQSRSFFHRGQSFRQQRPVPMNVQGSREAGFSFRNFQSPLQPSPTSINTKSSAQSSSSQYVPFPQQPTTLTISQIPLPASSSFARKQKSRLSLLPGNFMKTLLPQRPQRVGRGGIRVNPFNDDSTELFNCVAKRDGLYPCPISCHHFFTCKGQAAFRKACDGGLVYNPGQKYCDWPYNYKCHIAVTADPQSNPQAGEEESMLQRVVCYYTNWAQYRPGPYNFLPEDIDPTLCTHINYAFANLTGNRLAAYEWNDDNAGGMYERAYNHIKSVNPTAKILLSVGGWTMSSPPFTDMVATQESRAEFATTSAIFLRDRNFDGLDIDWEYPGSRGSPPEDKVNFVELLKELDAVFTQESSETGRPRLLLTAAVAAGKFSIDAGYDIPAISTYLDFINLMTYDLHGGWETVTGHNSPLYALTGETGGNEFLNVDWAANYWVSQGAPKEKLVIGLPTYGRSFTLQSSASSGVGALVSGPGNEGAYTKTKGYLSYYEICQMKLNGGVVYNIADQQVPYLVKGDQWVGFDDVTSLRNKVQYAKTNGFGGVMVWTAALDDFVGDCGEGINPLLSAIDDEYRSSSSTAQQADDSPAPNEEPPPPAPEDPTAEFCSGMPDALYVDHTDCSFYYQCANGATYRMSCGPGLLFNIDINACDWPANVDGSTCVKP